MDKILIALVLAGILGAIAYIVLAPLGYIVISVTN